MFAIYAKIATLQLLRSRVGPAYLLAVLLFSLGISQRGLAALPLTCDSKLMIASPRVRDAKFAEDLVNRTKDALAQKFSPSCRSERFVASELARAQFDYIGMSSYFSKQARDLSKQQVQLLVENTGATHLALTNWQDSQRALVVRVVAITNSYTLSPLEVINIHLSPAEVHSMQRTSALVRTLALLTPNTVTLGFVTTQVDFNPRSRGDIKYREAETKDRSTWPPIISSIGFNKIEHVDTFHRYDAAGSLFPSTYLFAIDQSTRFNPSGSDVASPDDRYATIRIYGICGNINAMGSLHTPLGTSYAGIGIGPCLHQLQQEDKSARWRFDGATRFLLGHRVFYNRKWYMFLEGDTLTFFRDFYSSQSATAKVITRGTLGIGYYLADVEHQYTKLVSPWLDKIY